MAIPAPAQRVHGDDRRLVPHPAAPDEPAVGTRGAGRSVSDVGTRGPGVARREDTALGLGRRPVGAGHMHRARTVRPRPPSYPSTRTPTSTGVRPPPAPAGTGPTATPPWSAPGHPARRAPRRRRRGPPRPPAGRPTPPAAAWAERATATAAAMRWTSAGSFTAWAARITSSAATGSAAGASRPTARANPGDQASTPMRLAWGSPGRARERRGHHGRVPRHAEQVAERDLGRDPGVPGRQEVGVPRPPPSRRPARTAGCRRSTALGRPWRRRRRHAGRARARRAGLRPWRRTPAPAGPHATQVEVRAGRRG